MNTAVIMKRYARSGGEGVFAALSRPRIAGPADRVRSWWRLGAVLPAALLCTSCVSELNHTYRDDVVHHALVAKPNGEWADPRDKLVERSARSPQETTLTNLEDQLRLIDARIKAQSPSPGKPLKLLVFVHGGLHTWEASSETYRRLRSEMERDGYYPIFIVWDSGFVSSYRDRLFLVRQGEDRPTRAIPTGPFVLPIDLATAVVRAPLVWTSELITDWRTTEYHDSPQQKDHEAVEDFLKEKLPGGGTFRAKDIRSNGERAYYFTSYFVSLPLKLLFSPVVDGLGSKAWDIMLRRTQTMYHPPARVDIFKWLADQRDWAGIVDPPQPPYHKDWRQEILSDWYERGKVPLPIKDAPVGMMWRFSRWLRDHSRDPGIEVHLYGHSMGTIVLNELLRQVPDVRVKQIGYLAAACSIRDWQTAVLPYLQSLEGQKAEFYALSLHRMREQSERNPGDFTRRLPRGSLASDFFEIAPRGSLLDWIDNFFSNPATISDRTLGSWENVLRVLPQFAVDHDGQRGSPETNSAPVSYMDRVHLRCFDAAKVPILGKYDAQPQKHGDFSEWPFWQPGFLSGAVGLTVPPRLTEPKPSAPMPPTKF